MTAVHAPNTIAASMINRDARVERTIMAASHSANTIAASLINGNGIGRRFVVSRPVPSRHILAVLVGLASGTGSPIPSVAASHSTDSVATNVVDDDGGLTRLRLLI
ncbi:MAG: hypothetical protein ACLQMO_09020 [Acidobacteriaceae bacterium]